MVMRRFSQLRHADVAPTSQEAAMKTLTIPLVAAGLLIIGCDSPPSAPTAIKAPTTLSADRQGNGVQHRVSVGSHDFTDPGVNANFSLVAIQHADGSVSGQWSDQFGHGDGGLHIAVDCVTVQGNRAWIGGVVTESNVPAQVGTRAYTEVEDNGTSANDPPDRISYSYTGLNPNFRCPIIALPLFPLSGGEVKVD
jgi:hypothetical protein